MTSVPDIADRTRSAVMHWQLTVGEKLAGGTCSAVYAARDEFGQDLVLKLPETRTRDVTGAEAAALAAWAGTGAAVALVDATADALLLGRVRPGTLMPWRPEERLDDTVEVAADLLRRLWAVTPGSYPYPPLADVYPHDERVAREDAEFEQRERGEPDRGAPGLVRLPAAAAAAERLISTTPAPTLLHGDVITKNILSDDTSPTGWVLIDPLPMMATPPPRSPPSPRTSRPSSSCRSPKPWLLALASPQVGRSVGQRFGACIRPLRRGAMTRRRLNAWSSHPPSSACSSPMTCRRHGDRASETI
jgi:streptomycin 6-kinase